MKKKCELCGGVARMYCESDQASLCWDCDQKVHGANFLVAKHTRCLLCSACQSPTPWKAAGPRLGPTVSACDACVSLQNSGGGNSRNGHDLSENRSQETNGPDYGDDGGDAESYDDDDEDEEYSDDDDDDDEEEEEEEEDDEEAENQVVPWAAAALQPPVVSSSSSVSSGGGEEAFPRRGGGGLVAKRSSDLLYSDV